MLRDADLIPAVPAKTVREPIDMLVQDYAHFLIQERCLSSITLAHRLPIVRQFLTYCFRSPDTVYRRAIPWQDDPIPYKFRWNFLKLDEDTEEGRRFLEGDVEALLFDPPKMERPSRRKLFVRK
jgi:hypothetical protein